MQASYTRFMTMIIVSTVVMFGLMYLNTWEFSHVWYSQTRTWMAVYTGAAMAVIMLAFMLPLTAILAGSNFGAYSHENEGT